MGLVDSWLILFFHHRGLDELPGVDGFVIAWLGAGFDVQGEGHLVARMLCSVGDDFGEDIRDFEGCAGLRSVD